MTAVRPIVVAAVLVLSGLALPAGTASAQECSIDDIDVDPLVLAYNENLDQVPGFLAGRLSDQTINVTVESPDGTEYFAVTTNESAHVTGFERRPAENPTLNVETTESTFCSIVASTDPAATVTDAYENDEITISGVGILNSVKVIGAKLIKAISDALSGIF